MIQINKLRTLVIIYTCFFLFLIPYSRGFISPTTITLIAESAGAFFWSILAILAVNIVLLFKKMQKKKKFILIIICVILLGIVAGSTFSRYTRARNLNTYEKINLSEARILSYPECIRHNYLSFMSDEAEISVLSRDEMISFLLTNSSFNILNIGNDVQLRFDNEIYVDQTTGDLDELYIKIKNLNKTKPLFIHCGGRGHTSSMFANILAREGFRNITILSTSPEEMALRMEQLKIDYSDYFKLSKKGDNKAIVRISYSTELNKVDDKSIFLFYKVSNMEDYVNDIPIFNERNSKMMYDLDFDYYLEKKEYQQANFMCDEEIECNILQSTLSGANISKIGYLVLLYE